MENDLTTGAPVGMIIPNNDIQDEHIDQYRGYKDEIRPGHAEYGFFKNTANLRLGSVRDAQRT